MRPERFSNYSHINFVESSYKDLDKALIGVFLVAFDISSVILVLHSVS